MQLKQWLPQILRCPHEAPGRSPAQGSVAALVACTATLLAGAVLLALSHAGTATGAGLALAALLVLAWRSGSRAAIDATLLTVLL